MDRHAKLFWMKEVLEHLNDCHREWEVAEGTAERFLAESMKRDLDEVRRICESLTAEKASNGVRHQASALVSAPGSWSKIKRH